MKKTISVKQLEKEYFNLLEQAEEIRKEIVKQTKCNNNVDFIIYSIYVMKSINRLTGVTKRQLSGISRKENIRIARHLYCLIMYENHFTLSQIGRSVNKHHSTVISANKSIKNDIDTNEKVNKLYREIKNSLKSAISDTLSSEKVLKLIA